MRWALYTIAVLEVLGALSSVSRVGKPREPITGPTAAVLVVIDTAIVFVLVLAAMRLS